MSSRRPFSSVLNRLSLGARTNIALSLVLVGTILLGVAGLVSVKQSFKTTLVKQQEVLVERVADDLDQKLLRLQGVLTATAATITETTTKNPDAAQAFLDGKTGVLSMFDRSLFLISAEGRLIAETPFLPNRRGQDGSSRDFVREILRTGQPYISRPYVTTKDDKNVVLMIAVPVLDASGRLIAILSGSLGLTQPGVLGNLQKAHIGSTGYFYLLTGDGQVVMHADPTQLLKRFDPATNELVSRALTAGFEGTDETVNSHGVLMLTSLKRLHSVDWILGANFPSAEAFQPYQAFLVRWGMISLGCIFVALALQHFLVRRFTVRLKRFSADLRGMAKVDGRIQPVKPQKDAELREVSTSFNELVEKLNEREAALLLNMQRFKLLAEHASDVIFREDGHGLIYVSPACEAVLGYAPAAMTGRPFAHFVLDEDQAITHASRRAALASGKPDVATYRVRKADGTSVWLETVTRAVRASGDTEWISVGRNVTERREHTLQIEQAKTELQLHNAELLELNAQLSLAHAKLVQSERLASLGQLAAGVAHEINNPIGYVFSNFGTLEKYLDGLFEMLVAYERAEHTVGSADVASELKTLRERVELDFLKADIPVLMRESKEGIVRVRQIVQDMKDFSRTDSTQEWQWANLHQGIDSTLNIVAGEVKCKAELVKQYGDIPDIECLPAQINQVVMNLLVNAAHSIDSERGQITIRTGTEGGQVWFEVADTGAGMSQETLLRIFDPFFTTKPIGKGTGLGLSLSYGIVQKHHGRIDVDSEVGRGTTFRVWLPVRQAKEETATNNVAVAEPNVSCAVPVAVAVA